MSTTNILVSPVIVGREAELPVLLRAVVQDRATIVIVGEAGVGKTRLVEELLDRPDLASHRRLTRHCQSLREPFLLGPVVEGLRSGLAPGELDVLPPVGGLLWELLPEVAGSMAPPHAPPDALASRRHQVYRAIVDVLSCLGPAVCVLEDLHWADDATVEFVEFLARHQPPSTKLVVTLRGEDAYHSPLIGARLPRCRRDVVRVELAPLSTEAVRQMVGAILGTEEVSTEFADYLRERTSGLPFAVEEVVRLVQDRRDLVRRDGHRVRRTLDALAVPPAVRDSVLERLAPLAPDARAVCHAAAVVGTPADEALVSTVVGLSPGRTAAGLCEVLRAAVLVEAEEATYAFRHALAAEAVHGSVPRPELRRLHLRAARALEARHPTPWGRLAHHFREAGHLAEAAQSGEAAGDTAVARHDEAAAVHFFEEALRLCQTDPHRRARLALKLGRTSQRAMIRHAEAAELLEAMLPEPSTPASVKGEIRLLLASLLTLAGDASSARAHRAASLADLADEPGLSALALAGLAQPGVAEGDIDEHLCGGCRRHRIWRRRRTTRTSPSACPWPGRRPSSVWAIRGAGRPSTRSPGTQVHTRTVTPDLRSHRASRRQFPSR